MKKILQSKQCIYTKITESDTFTEQGYGCMRLYNLDEFVSKHYNNES